MPKRLRLPIVLASLAATALAASAEPKVVTSIKPVHSLVAGVMQGVGTPELLLTGAASPHTASLKPSQAAQLQEADIIFWVGHDLEAFLEKPVESIGGDAASVEFMDAHDLIKLPIREGGAFESHDHSDHAGHDDHGHGDEHAEKDHDHDHDHGEKHAEKDHDHDHDHGEKHAEKDHDHDHDHGEKHAEKDHDHDHDHGEKHAEKDHDHDAKEAAHKDEHDHDHASHDGDVFDMHVWLDPRNAKAFVREIEEVLSEKDPANAATYEKNASALMTRLDELEQELKASLKSVEDKGFIVFHDAYQYFENRFGVKAAGSITISPEVLPGADRVREVQDRIRELDATCVFSEPQFEPKLVNVVIEGTGARTGVLDPLGADIAEGTDHYFELMRAMGKSLENCLSGTG